MLNRLLSPMVPLSALGEVRKYEGLGCSGKENLLRIGLVGLHTLSTCCLLFRVMV